MTSEPLDLQLDLRLVDCPYCGETVEIALESDLAGEMVWDCEVCCRPWRLVIHGSGEERQLEIGTLED